MNSVGAELPILVDYVYSTVVPLWKASVLMVVVSYLFVWFILFIFFFPLTL
jgi:hypothetical protein